MSDERDDKELADDLSIDDEHASQVTGGHTYEHETESTHPTASSFIGDVMKPRHTFKRFFSKHR